MNPFIGIGVGAFANAAVAARQRERDEAYRQWQMNFQEKQFAQQMLMDELQRKQLTQSMDQSAQKFDWAKQDRPRDVELQTANIEGVKLGNKRTNQLYNQSEEMFPIQKQGEQLKNTETEETIDFNRQYRPRQFELIDEQITGAKETNRHSAAMNPMEEYGASLENKQKEITLKYLPQKEQAQIDRLYYHGNQNPKNNKTGNGMNDKQFEDFVQKQYRTYRSSVNTKKDKIMSPDQWLKTQPSWMYRRHKYIMSGNADDYYAETPVNQWADDVIQQSGGSISEGLRNAFMVNHTQGYEGSCDPVIDRLITRYNEDMRVQGRNAKYTQRDWEVAIGLYNQKVITSCTPAAIPKDYRGYTDFWTKNPNGVSNNKQQGRRQYSNRNRKPSYGQ